MHANRWWVSELLAADCDEVCLNQEGEVTMQQWYKWVQANKEKNEKESMEEEHRQLVEKMKTRAEGGAAFLH